MSQKSVRQRRGVRVGCPEQYGGGARGPRTLAKSPRPSGDGHRPRGARSWPRRGEGHRQRHHRLHAAAPLLTHADLRQHLEPSGERPMLGVLLANASTATTAERRARTIPVQERRGAAGLGPGLQIFPRSRPYRLRPARHHRRLPGVSPADSTFVIALLTAGAAVSSRSSSAPSAASPSSAERIAAQSEARHQSNRARVLITGKFSEATNSRRW